MMQEDIIIVKESVQRVEANIREVSAMLRDLLQREREV